jgi:hypothetical protein
MGIFGNKQVTKAAISPAPKVQAAVGVGGVQSIGQFYQYQEGTARNRAMSLATVSRSRDLLASVIACMPLQMYNEIYDDSTGEMEQVPIAPRSWLRQPDPTVTYPFLMAWTLDDLLFYGRAFWFIAHAQPMVSQHRLRAYLPAASQRLTKTTAQCSLASATRSILLANKYRQAT